MLIDHKFTNIKKSHSILAFETQGGGSLKVWDRYLTVEGKRAFHIGNVCDTCSFFFERMSGANQSVNPEGVAELLNSGILELDKTFLDALQKIFPKGEYLICLTQIHPELVIPGGQNDYFCKEEVELWGIDGFWGFPHFPKTEYYRLKTKKFSEEDGLFEFLIPMFPSNWLKEKRVDEYLELSGKRPTAVSISVLDIKQPADWEGEKDIVKHWCLAHYLVDGHHKVFAAAKKKKPITLISFIAFDKGVSNKKDIQKLIDIL